MVELVAGTDVPVELVRKRRTSNRGSLVMAAMLGLAEVLGWENNREQTVEIASAGTDAGLGLSFGPLPPLN